MSMISPETVKEIEAWVVTQKGDSVTLPRDLFNGLIAEVKQCQAWITAGDQAKIDLIQRFMLEYCFHSIADSLLELSHEEWNEVTASEALGIASERIRKTPLKKVECAE